MDTVAWQVHKENNDHVSERHNRQDAHIFAYIYVAFSRT